MNTLDLAELRLFLNRTGRRDWHIQTMSYIPGSGAPRPTELVLSPGHKIQIGLRQTRELYWRSWLSVIANNPRNPSTDFFSSGDSPADACRNAIAEAEQNGVMP